ncbi:CIA30 family protein [Nisaea sp.]|uniref:CIA30 family protein n=1 Tax=Nisaea sp. TaxID=2024842 RepID=UPI003B51BD09
MRVCIQRASVAFIAVLALSVRPGAAEEERPIETFEDRPETRWEFIADTVMGGVSTGRVGFLTEDGTAFARMTGTVSTENNGGFIQFRTRLDAPPPDGTGGVRLIVRGNDQRYFVHLRTTGTLLPWQYYQAGFEATPDWTEVRLPLADFARSGWPLAEVPAPGSLTSVAIVAFGRDHAAEIEVREVGFYRMPGPDALDPSPVR